MADLSLLSGQTQIKKIDEKTTTRYTVVEEKIDLEALRNEKANLEAQLAEKEPSQKELLEFAQQQHPFYLPKLGIQERLTEIDKILEAK